MITPDAALVLDRFLFDSAVLFLWGASAYLAILVPKGLREEIWARLGPFRGWAIACAVVAVLLALPLRAATIGDGWKDAINPAMMADIVMETTVGTAWLGQTSAVGLLCMSLVLPRRFRIRAVAGASALALASLAVTGHAVMNSGWPGYLHQANDIIHLLAGGAWFGSLLPVFMILPKLKDVRDAQPARTALTRFSTAGHAAVAIVIMSGVLNIWLIVKGLPTDWTLIYQRLLVLKIGVVVVMTLIAIVNRYVFVPSVNRRFPYAALSFATLTEIVLALIAISLVAWFGMLEPT